MSLPGKELKDQIVPKLTLAKIAGLLGARRDEGAEPHLRKMDLRHTLRHVSGGRRPPDPGPWSSMENVLATTMFLGPFAFRRVTCGGPEKKPGKPKERSSEILGGMGITYGGAAWERIRGLSTKHRQPRQKKTDPHDVTQGRVARSKTGTLGHVPQASTEVEEAAEKAGRNSLNYGETSQKQAMQKYVKERERRGFGETAKNLGGQKVISRSFPKGIRNGSGENKAAQASERVLCNANYFGAKRSREAGTNGQSQIKKFERRVNGGGRASRAASQGWSPGILPARSKTRGEEYLYALFIP